MRTINKRPIYYGFLLHESLDYYALLFQNRISKKSKARFDTRIQVIKKSIANKNIYLSNYHFPIETSWALTRSITLSYFDI